MSGMIKKPLIKIQDAPASPHGVTVDEVKLELLAIENRMGRVGDWNLHERWKSGRYLVSLRSAVTRYLPKGNLTMFAGTLKVSTRELSDRMRVADTYRTDAEFKKAAKRYGTWTAILKSLEATREARTGSTRKSRDWRRIAYEALGHLIAGKLMRGEGLHHAQKVYDILEEGGE
jgi:hypothetical protein